MNDFILSVVVWLARLLAPRCTCEHCRTSRPTLFVPLQRRGLRGGFRKARS
jgi:hypothetical protein